jgi:acetyl/propionyl-CoA carboxylase alpha subunit
MDSAALAAKLASYDATPVTSASALNEALGQFGVPEIRNTVSGLRTTVANTTNSLNAVDPSVTGRTQGSLVTEAQRQRQVSNERAPIADQLTSQTGALTEQQQALKDALDQATTTASGKVNDYNQGRSALQGEYDIAYKREQDTAAASRAAAQDAESKRQFDAGLSEKYANGSSTGSGSTADSPGSAQRKDGGFNFTNASGQPISARLYAQLTGTSFNTLLKKMAASGDKGAAEVLKSGGSAKSYKALTWD